MLIGRNSTFSCIAENARDISWHAHFPNETNNRRLTYETVGAFIRRNKRNDTTSQITAAVTITATQSWNNTALRCYAIGKWSDYAYLRIYTSLRKLQKFYVV